MINLPVDEAYAFDYLAILAVKKDHAQAQVVLNSLKEQLPQDKVDIILSSAEYNSLMVANQAVFNAVEKARYGDISAKELDNVNMDRYYAKKALQSRFFYNNLTEKKT